MTETTITAHADPAGEAPWAMQLVAHVDKQNPPRHTDVLEAAATATVLLLDRVARHGTDTERAAVDRWLAGRIRKVVRRARASAWQASDLPGSLTVTRGTATVRAYLPGPVDAVAPQLSKLQVSGLDLDDTGLEPDLFPDSRVVVYLNPHVTLSTGKAAAQVAHAAQLAHAAVADRPTTRAWVCAGAPVTVVTPTANAWDELTGRAPVQITDAGFTEIPPGTRTCVATHLL